MAVIYGTPEHTKALEQIQEQLRLADEALEKAAVIAEDAGLDFSWDGPSYGMGGYYTSKKAHWESSACEYEDNDYDGWTASSTSC